MANKPLSVLVEHPPFVTENEPCQVSIVFDGTLNHRLADTLPNVIIRASDNVYFAVHSGQILTTSKNQFGGHLTATSQYTSENPAFVSLPEASGILNDLLHTMYGLPCDLHWPSLESIRAVLDALRKYGMIPLEVHVFQDTFIHHAIVRQAEDHPFEAYALAAEYGLEDVAVATSAKTIHSRVYELSLDLSARMGVSYLRRLHILHALRAEALKQLLVVRMAGHAQSPSCTAAQQDEIHIDFQLLCAKLFMDEPALYREDLETKLNEFREQLACQDCKAVVATEVDRIIAGFNNLQTTI